MTEIESICESVGVRVVPVHTNRGPLETHAQRALRRVLETRGETHLHLVLRSIIRAKRNHRCLTSWAILAMSDVISAHPDWIQNGDAWMSAMDELRLSRLIERAKANRRAVKLRYAIATMLYLQLSKQFEALNARAA